MDGGRAHWMMLPFSRVEMYLHPISLINTYSINYLAVWGQEGVDAVGANWMTLSFWEASIILIQMRHTLMDLVDVLVFME